MRKINGFYWPDDVGQKWLHSFKHVESLEWSIKRCRQKRTAVQAGGNIGLWPRRLSAAGFSRVMTFEPEDVSRACLAKNVQRHVEVFPCALGAEEGSCSIQRRSLGSHQIVSGETVPILPLDNLELRDLDFLQLDVEGYEWHALSGAARTIARCRPLIQVELRSFSERYGKTDADITGLLEQIGGYVQVSEQPGNDFVFEAQP